MQFVATMSCALHMPIPSQLSIIGLLMTDIIIHDRD